MAVLTKLPLVVVMRCSGLVQALRRVADEAGFQDRVVDGVLGDEVEVIILLLTAGPERPGSRPPQPSTGRPQMEPPEHAPPLMERIGLSRPSSPEPVEAFSP